MPFGGRFYFPLDDGVSGEELWSTDLTPAGMRQVMDLCPGTCSSRPHHVVQPAGANGWTLFAARPVGIFEGREQLWNRLPVLTG